MTIIEPNESGKKRQPRKKMKKHKEAIKTASLPELRFIVADLILLVDELSSLKP